MGLPFLTGAGFFRSDVLGGKKGTITPLRQIKQYEIELFADDYAGGSCNGEQIPYKKDCVMIFRPGDQRCSRLPFSCYYLHLDPVGSRLFEEIDRLPRMIELKSAEPYIPYFRDAAACFPQSESGSSFRLLERIFGLLAELENELQRTSKEETVSDEGNAVAVAKVFFNENLQKPLRLSDAAELVQLSPNYFHALFTKTCGMTPLQYLNEARMARARFLLLTTAQSVSEIAAACGFTTYNYFCSRFKTHFGMTPARYRRTRGLYSL